jgi:hypothetical protein
VPAIKLTLTHESSASIVPTPFQASIAQHRRRRAVVGAIETVLPFLIRVRKESYRMKWVLMMIGSAGLLTGLGCASQQPLAYYNTPPTMAPPAQYAAAAPPPQYYAQPAPVAQPAPPQYYAQPAAPVVQAAPSAVQPVMYAAPQQACVPCVPCQ